MVHRIYLPSFRIRLPNENDVEYAKRLIAGIALRESNKKNEPKLTPLQITDLRWSLDEFTRKYQIRAKTASQMTQEEFDQKILEQHDRRLDRTLSAPAYRPLGANMRRPWKSYGYPAKI